MKNLRKTILICILLAALPWLVFPGGRREKEPDAGNAAETPHFQFSAYSGSDGFTADEIMDQVNSSLISSDIIADITMTLENANGIQRVRELSIKSKEFEGTSKSILHFTAPADITGTGFLMIETEDGTSDMWLFLPELNKSRKIVSSGKNDSFMGSDITYSDMEGRPVDDYTFTRFEDETVDNEDCYCIEAVTIDDEAAESTGYRRTVYAVSKEKMIPLRGYMFNLKDEFVKQMKISQVTKLDGSWIPSFIEVENVQEGHKTIMQLNNIEVNSNPDDSYFTQQYLKRGF